MPTTSNMLQAYWIDYEVWFRETSVWKYQDCIERYLVMPPFTNHSDAPLATPQGTVTTPAPTTVTPSPSSRRWAAMTQRLEARSHSYL